MYVSRQGIIRFSPLAMEYDNYFLENEIKGYRTLSVKGREMINVEIEKEKPSGRNGAYILGQTLPAREITVNYFLEAESNEEFRHYYSLLMRKLLKTEDVGIRFADESDTYYYGRYSSSEDVPDNKNWAVSSFTIYCQDPYKYTKAITTQSQNDTTIGYLTDYPTKPDEIKIIVGSDVSKITIDNLTTGRHIILNGTYTTGQEIKIRIPDNEVTRNGQNIKNNLDYMESDFHNFLISNGDSIQVTPDSTLSITVRGRTL